MMQFQSQPRAVAPPAARKKYREQAFPASSRNIMHDPRVIRGSTYAATVHTVPPSAVTTRALSRASTTHTAGTLSRKSRTQSRAQTREQEERAVTPPPVDGRAHFAVQTFNYLEELTDKPVEYEMAIQTDPAQDRPMTPLFIPRSSGDTKSTQIEDGELFDFDLEVSPLLEVLVGKATRQALLEVCEEQEIKALHRQRAGFELRRDAQLAVVRKMEGEERRRHAEKDRRLAQEKERAATEAVEQQHLLARRLARDLFFAVQTQVFEALEAKGHFYDPVQREIENIFLPRLFSEVCVQVEEASLARISVDGLMAAAVQKGFDEIARVERGRREAQERAIRERIAAEQAELARIQAEAEAKRVAEEVKKAAEAERLRLEAEQAAKQAEEEEHNEDDEDEDGSDDENTSKSKKNKKKKKTQKKSKSKKAADSDEEDDDE